jgi:hypothetical protein
MQSSIVTFWHKESAMSLVTVAIVFVTSTLFFAACFAIGDLIATGLLRLKRWLAKK